MTDRQWQERYEITSTKGRIWTRAELRKRAIDTAEGLLLHKVPRAAVRIQINGLLNDDAFMRARRGMVPARVVEDLAYMVFTMLWPGVRT